MMQCGFCSYSYSLLGESFMHMSVSDPCTVDLVPNTGGVGVQWQYPLVNLLVQIKVCLSRGWGTWDLLEPELFFMLG